MATETTTYEMSLRLSAGLALAFMVVAAADLANATTAPWWVYLALVAAMFDIHVTTEYGP